MPDFTMPPRRLKRSPRFTLRFLLIAITVGSVLCFFGYRVIAGTAADHRAATAAAKEGIREHGLYARFDVDSIKPIGINPRVYRVYGRGNGRDEISVVVVKRGERFVWDYVETAPIR